MQDHELLNGKHIVSYEEGNDVPESKLAVKANGKQIRYLKLPCDASKELTSIELVKGDDFSMPLVFALTVESADDNKQASPPTNADVSLKDVQDAYFVGAAGDVPGRYSDDELILAKTHFNFWTPENCMKPAPIHPQEDEWRFERADALVDWCAENAVQVHGHTLVWHSQTNDWFWRDGDKELTIERMKQHIHTLVGRYKGKIHSWDVVNEAINDRGDPTTENLRRSGWLSTIGPEFISLAFKFAHEADPDAVLYYNDYDIERGDKHSSSMLLLKRLIDDGAPIHGVGIQGHWSTNNVPFEEIDKAISDYASLGLKVSLTELDVTIRGASGGQFGRRFGRRREVTPPSEEDLAKQAEAYHKLFAIFNKHEDKIERVTFWGLHDRRTWRFGQHPLLFDRDLQRKPAFDAVVDVMSQLKTRTE
jgi:GH35 family endo-1,4-beta-xylanase